MLGEQGQPDSIRGKIVILQNFSEPRYGGPRYGIEYPKVDTGFTQDYAALDNNWDLYSGKWERVERHLNLTNSPDSQRHQIYVNFMSGSADGNPWEWGTFLLEWGSLPYFVASGHSSPGTGAPRLATGATTPLFGDKWQKFPRVDCFLGICTIAFEGVNMLVRDQILNTPILRRTGVMFMDFPGACLIDAIINVNPMPAPPGLQVTLNNDPAYGRGHVTSADGKINCSAAGQETCKADYADAGTDTAVLTATADADSVFHSWQGPGVLCGGSNPCPIAMYGNRNVTPWFLLKPRLTVTPVGAGSGLISSASGINCADDCEQRFPFHTMVTLNASAEPGSVFAGWHGSDDCLELSTDCTVTMSGDIAIEAQFDLTPQTLSVSKSGKGEGRITSDLAGIDCGLSCSHVYRYSNRVTLTAEPWGGSQFISWGGAASGCGAALTCSVDANGDLEVTAQFDRKPQLRIYPEGDGSGTVTSTPAGMNCGGLCGYYFPKGETITLAAVAGPASAFDSWGGDPDCSDGEITLDISKECTARFVKTEYRLTVDTSGFLGSGSVASEGDSDIDCGDDCSEVYTAAAFPTPKTVTLTATPDAGSLFTTWAGNYDCSPTQEERSNTSGATIAVTMNRDQHCKASFVDSSLEFDLTVQKLGGGFGTVSASPTGSGPGISCTEPVCSQTYPAAIEVILTVQPVRGSKFTGWKGAPQCEFPNGPNGGVIMSQNLVCQATFELPVLVVDDDQANDSNCKFGEQSSDSVCQAYLDALSNLNSVDHPNPIEDPPDPSQDHVPEFTIGSDDIWNTGSDGYPTASDLAPYSWVIWFSGSEDDTSPGSGTSGPDPNGEAALAEWLEQAGGCLAISSQQYYADRNTGGQPSDFMQEYLGVSSVTDNGGQPYSSVKGVGPVLSGLGPYNLSYSGPTGNFSDLLSPGPGTEMIFEYTAGATAAVQRDSGVYRTVYFGFPLENLQASARIEVLREVIDFCHDTLQRKLIIPNSLGSGSGTVSADVPVDCSSGASCIATVNVGTEVTLTAEPQTGSVLHSWVYTADTESLTPNGIEAGAEVACANELTCRIKVDTNQSLTARFEPSRTVNVAATGGGSGSIASSPDGIQCGGDCEESFAEGAGVVYTATPSAGSAFVSWGDAAAGCGAAQVCELTVSGDQTVSARFEALQMLTVAASGFGSGTISSNPVGIACGDDCTEAFPAGAAVALTAIAEAGWKFLQWQNAGERCSTDPACELLITTSLDVYAQFEGEMTLTVSKTGAGNGTVSSANTAIACGADCSGSYARGAAAILTAVADANSVLSNWGQENAACGRKEGCEVVVDADRLVNVRFDPARTLTVIANSEGQALTNPAGLDCPGNCSSEFAQDESVVVIAIPAVGFQFDGWGGDCSGTDSVIEVILNQSKTCTMTFSVAETIFEHGFEY